MAISQAMCTSFKAELLLGVHDFRNTSGDTFKIALYTSSASLGADTTAFTTSNEVSGTNYSSVGKTTLKLPAEADLSPPKFSTQTAGFVRLELLLSLALGVLL